MSNRDRAVRENPPKQNDVPQSFPRLLVDGAVRQGSVFRRSSPHCPPAGQTCVPRTGVGTGLARIRRVTVCAARGLRVGEGSAPSDVRCSSQPKRSSSSVGTNCVRPLHRHCAQQRHWPWRRPIDPTGGSAGRSDSQWAPEELRKMVIVRRVWGTQRANPGAPAAQGLCPSTLRGTCTQSATTGAPDAFHAATSARRGSGTQGTNSGAPAAQRRCSSAPRGSCAQWATAGARAGQGTWGSRTRKHREAGYGRPENRGAWTAKTVKRPPQQPAQPPVRQLLGATDAQTACHATSSTAPAHRPLFAPRTRKQQRTRKQHQQEHWPQRPTESSDPTQHAKGRTGDRPGPRTETTTRRNVTQGGLRAGPDPAPPPPHSFRTPQPPPSGALFSMGLALGAAPRRLRSCSHNPQPFLVRLRHGGRPPPPQTHSDVLERPYTAGGEGYPRPLDPPPLLPFQYLRLTAQISAPSAPRGFKLQKVWPAFHRGTLGGGGFQPPHPPLSTSCVRPKCKQDFKRPPDPRNKSPTLPDPVLALAERFVPRPNLPRRSFPLLRAF